MFFSVASFLILTVLYSLIVEFCGYGTIAGTQIIPTFAGFDFALQLFFQLFLIAIMIIISNFIYQKVEDRNMRFNLLVERYKSQIKQVLVDQKKQKENGND